MMNVILFNILKVILFPVWGVIKKQVFVQVNQVIDQLQEKYLDNTNTIKRQLLSCEVNGDKNLATNEQIKEVVQEAQNNFNLGLGLDSNGKPTATAGLNIKF